MLNPLDRSGAALPGGLALHNHKKEDDGGLGLLDEGLQVARPTVCVCVCVCVCVLKYTCTCVHAC